MVLSKSFESKDFTVTVSVQSKDVAGHAYLTDYQYDVSHRLGLVCKEESELLHMAFETMKEVKHV